MNAAFKREVMACMEEFATAVHANFDYDDAQLDRLKHLLCGLADALRNETVIDKDLALHLYDLPQFVRNRFLSHEGPLEARPAHVQRLEDAWVDLDALVTECLQPPRA